MEKLENNIPEEKIDKRKNRIKRDRDYFSIYIRLEELYKEDREILNLMNKIPKKMNKLGFLKALIIIGFNHKNKLYIKNKKKGIKENV